MEGLSSPSSSPPPPPSSSSSSAVSSSPSSCEDDAAADVQLVGLVNLRYPFSPTARHEVVHQVTGFLGKCLARVLVRLSRALHAVADPYLKDVDGPEYADVAAVAVKRVRWT